MKTLLPLLPILQFHQMARLYIFLTCSMRLAALLFFYQKQENKNCISFLVSAYILSSLLFVDFKILYLRSGVPQRKDDRDGEARQVIFE